MTTKIQQPDIQQHPNHLKQHFLILSLNHKTVELKNIPKFTIACENINAFMTEIAADPAIDELVVLSTCNRAEFFVSTHSVKDAAHSISKKIAKHSECTLEPMMEQFDVMVDAEAVEHLFRLVSGLDSMVVGDAQILGQVKAAFQNAQELELVGKIFNAVFQRAFNVAKKVKKETGLGKGRLSISALAVEYAQQHFGCLNQKVATVIGAGKMGSLAAKYFNDAGVKELRIINRSLERSLELAQRIDAKVYGFDELDRVLAESDIVVSTTAATEHIVTKVQVEIAQAKRQAPQLLIDISLPLDIDPRVSEIDGITFIDMDVLRELSNENLALRNEAVEKANEIVDKELCKLGPWPLPFHIDSVARQLGNYADTICQEEITNLFASLPDLTPQQREVIETQMIKVAERIVLAPRRNLRKRNQATTCVNVVQCLADLFEKDCGARQKIKSNIQNKINSETTRG